MNLFHKHDFEVVGSVFTPPIVTREQYVALWENWQCSESAAYPLETMRIGSTTVHLRCRTCGKIHLKQFEADVTALYPTVPQ
jgi:hypothetical protein